MVPRHSFKPFLAGVPLVAAAAGLVAGHLVARGGEPAPVTTGKSGVPVDASAEGYRKLADLAESALRADVLDVWFPRAVDQQHGGFHADFARDWTPTPSAQGKFSVFQARMTWMGAQIALRRPDLKERFLPVAQHGLAYLTDVLWDKQDGGFFWGLDEQGKISPAYTDGKHLYGNAFCLYALAAVYQATKDPAVLAFAQRVFRWIDQHGHDAKDGGYFEWLSRDGKPVPAQPETGRIELLPVAQFPVGYKSMNTHIHLLESFTELYQVWKDPTLRRRIQELVVILRDKVSAPPGVMSLYLTNQWVALPGYDSYGHDVEAAYLLLEAEDVLGRGHAPATERMARMLVDHALAYGWDQNLGGFYREGTSYDTTEDKRKEWWVQAEGLNALLLMHEKYGKTTDAYFKAFQMQWQFLFEHQRDAEFHGLHEMVDAQGRPLPGGKGRIWKEGYHEGRALMNVIARLQRLAREAPPAPSGSSGGGTGAAATPPPPPGSKAAVTARLLRLSQSGQFLFGQENATLWGMYRNGGLVSTGPWFDATARAGKFTADSEALVGDQPAVLGVSLGMLALEPVEWNRRAVIARAMRHHLDAGGLVTMDWHAPSCNASTSPGKPLATVKVDGREVVIQSVLGGTSFYAEDEYRHPITSRADVPETVKCLCQIANDQPLGAGAYRGVSGKTWLTAHAKHTAQVLRDQGLGGAPIIVRPFHEQTGPWFWWGQAYWNCAALLGKPEALSGPDAYKEVSRSFVTALRNEPGMENLLFAFSPDRLLGPRETEPFTPVQDKLMDPTGYARDRLREQMVKELGAAGLAWQSPIQARASLRASQTSSPRRADQYVAQRRPFYAESYAGDDVFDLLGIDLYHPAARPANASDLRLFGLQLRILAEEARARGKPYALTEAGTYRLHLAELARRARPGQPLVINGKKSVDDALAMLHDPAAQKRLLRHFGLTAAGPVALDDAERAVVLPKAKAGTVMAEDWYTTQLLPLAKQAKVSYALVWQTYFDTAATERYAFYYVPYPGHPDAPSFQRFYDDPATCFLRDRCAE